MHRRQAFRNPAPWFILPAILVLVGVAAGPMLYSMQASLTHWMLTDPGSENDPAGLSNYVEVLTSVEFWTAVRVTVTYAVLSICGALGLGLAFAVLLNLEFYG